jgi:hypothetical protein
MDDHLGLALELCGEFWHRDIGLGVNPTDKLGHMRGKLTCPRRAALPRGRCRSCFRDALNKLDRATRTDTKSPRRIPTGMARQHVLRYPITKIARVGLSHDPPPNDSESQFYMQWNPADSYFRIDALALGRRRSAHCILTAFCFANGKF